MSDEVVKILLSIALVIISGVLSILGIWIKEKYSSAKIRSVFDQIRAVVNAAEIIGAAHGWEFYEKKAWAVEQAAKFLKISEEQLDVFIEAAVAELKAWGNELVADKNGEIVRKCDQPIEPVDEPEPTPIE